jgi:hypothetical protein
MSGTHSHNVQMSESGKHTHIVSKTGANKKIDIMPPYYTMVFIIKYK